MVGFDWWQKWLLAVGCLVTLFGAFVALANASTLFQPFNQQIAPVFWGYASLPSQAVDFRTWVYAAWGATVAGWGIFIVFIAARPFQDQQTWAWWCLQIGL